MSLVVLMLWLIWWNLGCTVGWGGVALAVLVILLDFLGLGCLGLCGFGFAVLVLADDWFGC